MVILAIVTFFMTENCVCVGKKKKKKNLVRYFGVVTLTSV